MRSRGRQYVFPNAVVRMASCIPECGRAHGNMHSRMRSFSATCAYVERGRAAQKFEFPLPPHAISGVDPSNAAFYALLLSNAAGTKKALGAYAVALRGAGANATADSITARDVLGLLVAVPSDRFDACVQTLVGTSLETLFLLENVGKIFKLLDSGVSFSALFRVARPEVTNIVKFLQVRRGMDICIPVCGCAPCD